MNELATSPALLHAALAVLGAGILLCVLRVARGPTPFDRVMALDCMVLEVVGAALVLSILLDTELFIDVVLVVTLLGFVATVALAAYLDGSLAE